MNYKTLRRDKLKRDIQKGLLEVKCNYRYTDDYAYDAASNYGKTDWMDAALEPEEGFGYSQEPMQFVGGEFKNMPQPRKENTIYFDDYDFKGSCSRAVINELGEIRFRIHSNLSYTLRYKAS